MSSIQTVWNYLTTRVRARFGNYEPVNEDAPGPSGTNTRSLNTDYTELMDGSVHCPSCKGTGRIPKELEETFVALIPINDDRLKPKKTWLWVLIGIAISFLLAFIGIFALVPRQIELVPSRLAVDIVNIVSRNETETGEYVTFYFMNSVNITNANYYNIEVMNTTASIASKFHPLDKDIIGSGMNSTAISIAPLSHHISTNLFFNNTVTITGVAAEYCQGKYSRLTALYVTMQFDIIVSIEYFHHKEQLTLSTQQPVCCVPSGNCTES